MKMKIFNVSIEEETEEEKDFYIGKMITKGGITEAIIESLKLGETYLTALRKGISRSRDISAGICEPMPI